MEHLAVGIDIGATYTKFGIMNKDGTLLASQRMGTGNFASFETYLDKLTSEIKAMMISCGNKGEILGLGIGAPNGNFYTGNIEYASNLPWKGIVPIISELEKRIELPIVMTNDANAAALGEMLYGGAGNMRDFIVITIGTGLGGGIVTDGNLVHGRHGMAGELGHSTVRPGGRECGCGKHGCLETYVSASGIIRTAMELMAVLKDDSILRAISYSEMTSELITEAAKKGDPVAAAVFDLTGKIFGIKLADTVAHTDPEAIFIFGGLAAAGDFLIEPAKKYMEKNLQPVFKNKIDILPSKLSGTLGAIAGACALIFHNYHEKHKDTKSI